MNRVLLCAVALGMALAACGDKPSAPPAHTTLEHSSARQTAQASPAAQRCAPASSRNPERGPEPRAATGLSVPPGFAIQIIADVPGAREIVAAPNGDLLVGTLSNDLYVVPGAEGARPARARVFASLPDSPAAGVALSLRNCTLYAGTQFGVYRISYRIGDTSAREKPVKIASVRAGGSSDHSTTSVLAIRSTLYASVGSSCDACRETDPTRATIQQMALDGKGMNPRAVHIRNAMALAENPATGTLWAGGAGQDGLPAGHPYEYFDPVGLHAGVANYGWPDCEENHHAYVAGANCSDTVEPRVEFPAYETIIGAVFYPSSADGAHAFPKAYGGGAFVAMHGSWHQPDGCYVPPRVAFVPMNGDAPRTPVDWSNPKRQWHPFVRGFQPGCSDSSRIGRPTGITVGPQGSLFIADDASGRIYRVRPLNH